MISNPFDIKTPEQNTAQDVVELFVDVFTDFQQVREKGHTFLNGPRGSGKSMMFRYIQPDCQIIAKKCTTKELDFFSVYVPIKLTNINIPDLKRLEEYAETIINEHLLSTYVIAKTYLSIISSYGDELDQYKAELSSYYNEVFVPYVNLAGHSIDSSSESDTLSGRAVLQKMAEITSTMNHDCLNYCKRIALFRDYSKQYTASITDFMDFVYPLLKGLKKLPFVPADKPFFLLIDDAGYLNLSQTKILNTWVSYRTTKDICFKISTQLDYKTHLTTNGKRIDSPHDYSEINISTVYASSKSKYNERISEIVRKRIKKYLGKDIEAQSFFPEDLDQKVEIDRIYQELKERHHDINRPYAGGDAARRYARPEYIKNLQRVHKSGFHYSYAGFNQLVAISSGIIRHFLAPAQEMFSETIVAGKKPEEIECIDSSIQDKIIKKYSNSFLTDEFDKIRKDSDSDEYLNRAEMLFNLIDSLGDLFHRILVSDLSERRVFSVALIDTPDNELREVLDMGEQFGYLHKSTIGNKQGTGRNRLYILSRILAPHFKLDPTSFAGYQFMDCATLKIALTNKPRFLQEFSSKLKDGGEYYMPSLFEDYEE